MMRQWFSEHLDDFLATMFVAVIVAALVGAVRRSTGAAVFVSCCCAGTIVAIAYPWVSDYGFDRWGKDAWKVLIPTFGASCGVLALALFKLAILISDKLEARNAAIADALVKKAEALIPGGKP